MLWTGGRAGPGQKEPLSALHSTPPPTAPGPEPGFSRTTPVKGEGYTQPQRTRAVAVTGGVLGIPP